MQRVLFRFCCCFLFFAFALHASLRGVLAFALASAFC
jgi:hypothetical protein